MISAAALSLATFKAWRSFDEWKQRETFSDTRRVALEVAVLAHRGVEVFWDLRNPLMSASEMARAEKELTDSGVDPTESGFGMVVRQRTIYSRFERFNSYWDMLIELRPRAKVYVGDTARELLNEIWSIRQDILIAIDTWPFVYGKEATEIRQTIFRTSRDTTVVDKLEDIVTRADGLLDGLHPRREHAADAP